MSEFDYCAAREAVYESALSVYGKAVLVQLIEHLPTCRPGLPRLCRRTSLSKMQVIREIHALEDLACVQVTRVAGLGNYYHLADDWMSRLPVVAADHPSPVVTSHSQLPVSTSDGTGNSQLPDQSLPGTGTGNSQLPKARSISKKRSRKGKQEGARATPTRSAVSFLPDGWKPSEEHLAYATEHSVGLDELVKKFKADVAGGRKPSKNAAAVSFDGIFWTYLRNDVKWAAERAARSGPYKAPPVQRERDEHVERGSWLDEPEPPKGNVVALPRVAR